MLWDGIKGALPTWIGRVLKRENSIHSTSDSTRREIQAEFSKEIHVGVQPLSSPEWAELFEKNEMEVIWNATAPMHLLEPGRLLRDEGLWGGFRVAFNMARNPQLRRRITAMRRVFRRYQAHLWAISMVGRIAKPAGLSGFGEQIA